MNNEVEILLNSYKNVKSINSDVYHKFELSDNISEINEYDIRNIVNATSVFDAEREANQIYRIHGRIEYMSLLNGLTNSYTGFDDFFNPQTVDVKNILNSFDFYLVRPSDTECTQIVGMRGSWKRYFKVVAQPSQFDIYPAGYANNVFDEQIYAFNFNVDIDISYLYDQFNFPVTELFLYAQYKNSSPFQIESLSATTWSNNGAPNKTHIQTLPYTQSIGDVLKCQNSIKIGDIIEYVNTQFYQSQSSPQEFIISTPYTDINSHQQRLMWKYNPLIPIRLRYLSDSLYQANTGSTSYDSVQSIPSYATNIGNGNFVWKNIMQEGYIDPLVGIGTNHPFINKRRYLFTTIILSIIPDMDDLHTKNKFNEIWFNSNTTNQNTKPIGDINDIGKPCK